MATSTPSSWGLSVWVLQGVGCTAQQDTCQTRQGPALAVQGPLGRQGLPGRGLGRRPADPALLAADLFDILLPMLNIYQEFVRNHQYSLQILAHCKQNRDFDKLLKHYEAKPDCEERTLETFLTYPMFQVGGRGGAGQPRTWALALRMPVHPAGRLRVSSESLCPPGHPPPPPLPDSRRSRGTS